MSITLTTNQAGLNLIKQFEGLRLHAYDDGGATPTIGYGHTGPGITPDMTITEDQANNFFLIDIKNAENMVRKYCKYNINENQFAALVSFVYNLGGGTLQRSKLLSDLNGGYVAESAEEFLKFCHVKGVEDDGLLKRRKAERDLFLLPPTTNQ